MSEYKYLGNFAACEPWAAQGMSCDDCMVSWTGCWDNFQCPKCGKGELPNCDTPLAVTAPAPRSQEVSDDWHAGYREGLRDGRNISTELAPSQEVPAQPQREPAAPYGKHQFQHGGVVFECNYFVPGLTLHDLTMIFEKASKSEGLSEYAGDPSKWPVVRGVEAVVQACIAALSGKPGAVAREAIARKLAAWIGYAWNGLPDHSAVERGGFGEWVVKTSFYQGGKPDLLRLADALMAHTRPERGGGKRTVTIALPDGYKDAAEFAEDCGFELAQSATRPEQCAQVPEEALADFLCDAKDRAGPGCDELAIAQALLAIYSVTRP